MTYDVKSSKFYKDKGCYRFTVQNKYKDKIEIYYFLAFNEDWTKLDYSWRVPGNIVEKNNFEVGLSNTYRFNIDSMEKYDITNVLKDIFKNIMKT
jgi:hypothetical protein